MTTDASAKKVLGVVLAGGRSSRMRGPDKALETLGQRSLLAHAVHRLGSQVQHLIINANGDTMRHRELGLPVIPDTLAGGLGPLAGILSAMRFAPDGFTHIASAATDTPFFPDNLVTALSNAAEDNDTIALSKSGGYRHPTFALWPISLADDLESWLAAGETPKIMAWAKRHPLVTVDFPHADGLDPFFNINTPEDLEKARAIIADAVSAT